MERETGIEPAPSAWKAEVLPLNYSRPDAVPAFAVACGRITPKAIESMAQPGGGRWITPGILPSALRPPSRAASGAFKIAPGDFVEPQRWFSSTSMALCL